MTKETETNRLSAEALNAMTTGEAAEAMAFAKLGPKYLPVCPPDHDGVSELHAGTCERPGKAPTIRKWTEKASDELATLYKWFGRHTNRNLGMTLGGEVGVVGFDVDGQYGQERMSDLFNGDIPATWTFSTPGGGMRFLFSVPKGQRVQKLVDADPDHEHEELALLADGQMTVIPPSLHWKGGQYRWMKDRGPGDVPLAFLPPDVLEKMRLRCSNRSAIDASSSRQEPSQTVEAGRTSKGPPIREQPVAASALSDPDLQKLVNKCHVVRQAVNEQTERGCNEELWHGITSMLVRSGAPNAAIDFSQLSEKHDERSELRIREMEAQGDSAVYGPTRCVTFGCDAEQITRCHDSIQRSPQTGTPSNTPVAFLSHRNTKMKLANPTTPAEYAKLFASRYGLKEGNLCLVKVDDKGSVDHIPMANFVARISKVITSNNGAERNTLYEIDGIIISTSKELSPVRVPASEYEGMKWLSEWGPEPNILPGNLLRDSVRHAIQSTAREAEHENIFAHLGWVKVGGKWVYLHAGGALGVPGVQVELDPRLKNYVLPEVPPDAKEAMQESIQLLDVAPRRVTLVLWSLVFLTPLCEILREANIEPKFVVWLHGYTGSRKTTIAKLFLSHFGNLLEHPSASFKDTANSVEKRGFDTKDSLLLIDDYHPTSSPQERRGMEQLAQKILRGYGDRVGRGRMQQDTSLRPDYPPRGMAIVTAEDMVGGGSSVARLFPAELKPSDIDLSRLSGAQLKARKLSEAMAGYLAWLGETMNAPSDGRLNAMFAEKRNEAASLSVHGRLVEASAMLHIGLQFGLDYAESIGAIEPEQKKHLLDEAWNLFLSTAGEQGEKVSEVKATERFVTLVSQLLANQSIHCDDLHTSILPETPPKSSVQVGWHDDNYYYFMPDMIYNAVSQFLSKQGEQFPITASTLWKELADAGYSHSETSQENGKERRHLLVKKSVWKKRQRLLWLKREALGEETQQASPKEKKKGAISGGKRRKPISYGGGDLHELEL